MASRKLRRFEASRTIGAYGELRLLGEGYKSSYKTFRRVGREAYHHIGTVSAIYHSVWVTHAYGSDCPGLPSYLQGRLHHMPCLIGWQGRGHVRAP